MFLLIIIVVLNIEISLIFVCFKVVLFDISKRCFRTDPCIFKTTDITVSHRKFSTVQNVNDGCRVKYPLYRWIEYIYLSYFSYCYYFLDTYRSRFHSGQGYGRIVGGSGEPVGLYHLFRYNFLVYSWRVQCFIKYLWRTGRDRNNPGG